MAVPFGRTALVYVAGFSMTPTPGKMGEALRLWLLERIHGFRYARTAAVMIGDRVGDLAAILALCLFGVGAFAGYGQSTAMVAVVGTAERFACTLGSVAAQADRGRIAGEVEFRPESQAPAESAA